MPFNFRSMLALTLTLVASVCHAQFFRVLPAQPLAGQDFSIELNFLVGSSCSYGSPASAEVINDEIRIRLPAGRGVCAQVVTAYQQTIRIAASQAMNAGSYQVKVIGESGFGPSKDQDLHFGLISLATDLNAVNIKPESGAWTGNSAGRYPTSGLGTGFSLEQQNDRVLINLSVYDRDGRPRWLLASGALQGKVFNGVLSQANNGQELFGEYKMPYVQENLGDLAIEFISPGEATVYSFGRPETDFAPEVLTRSTFTRLDFGYGGRTRGFAGKWVYLVDDAKDVPSQPLQLEAVRDTGNYVNTQGVYALLCDAQSREQFLPTSCQLRRLNVLQEAVFDRVGFRQMRGKDALGRSVSLIRLD